MSSPSKIKIVVLKRFAPSEVFKVNPIIPIAPLEACGKYKDGQEFIVAEDGKMPEGFCTSAWNAIFPLIRTLSFGGNPPWYKEKGTAVQCCTDGLRPVVFKLSRI